MQKTLKDWLTLFLFLLIAFIIITTIVFGICAIFGKLQCNQFAALNPYEQFRYSIWNGCLIRWNSLWMPYEAIIIR